MALFKKARPKLELNIQRQRATRAVFFLVGFGLAIWAPLVPYAKNRLGLADGVLGLLLLCLGTGSIITMPVIGILASRFSCRRVITVSSLCLILVVPFLVLSGHVAAMAVSLLFFGGAIGAIDVAGNIQAIIVQRESRLFMMSGFHAFYSIGGLCGAGFMSFLLWLGLSPMASCLISDAVLVGILAAYQGKLLSHTHDGDGSAHFAIPRGIVLITGILCFITYLSEGIIFDWGSLFLVKYKSFDQSYAGLGMAVFSLMLAIGRLWGSHIIHAMGGGTRVVLIGGIFSAIGLLLAVFVLPGMWALIGYGLLGISVSNIVPIIFTAAGQQNIIPVNDAVSIVTTLGYTGTLLGPALIGFMAQATTLATAFVMVAMLMLVLGYSGRFMFPKKGAS